MTAKEKLTEYLTYRIAEKGPMSMHVSWGEGADMFSEEERAEILLHFLTAPEVEDSDVF